MAFSSKDFYWHCVLTSENPTVEWNPIGEEESDDEDEDYLTHTLNLHNACLLVDADVTSKTNNYVEATSSTVNGEIMKGTLFGINNTLLNCPLTISFQNPVEFTLIKGKGPIHITGSHNIAFAADDMDFDVTDDDEGDSKLMTPGSSGSSRKKRLSNASDHMAIKRSKLGKSPSGKDSGESKTKVEDVDMDEDEEDNDGVSVDDVSDENEEVDSDEVEDEDDKRSKSKEELMKINVKKAVNKENEVKVNAKPLKKDKEIEKEANGSEKIPSMGRMKAVLKKATELPKSQQKLNNFIKRKFHLPEEDVEIKGAKLWKWIQEGMTTAEK